MNLSECGLCGTKTGEVKLVSNVFGVLWCVVVSCGVWWCVVVCCGVLWCVVVCRGVLWCLSLGTDD